MKQLTMILSLVAIIFALQFNGRIAVAETIADKAEVALDKSANAVKKTYRNVKDKTCEMVNGKMHCIGQKIKHKVKNAADAVEVKTKELTN